MEKVPVNPQRVRGPASAGPLSVSTGGSVPLHRPAKKVRTMETTIPVKKFLDSKAAAPLPSLHPGLSLFAFVLVRGPSGQVGGSGKDPVRFCLSGDLCWHHWHCMCQASSWGGGAPYPLGEAPGCGEEGIPPWGSLGEMPCGNGPGCWGLRPHLWTELYLCQNTFPSSPAKKVGLQRGKGNP